MFTDFLSKKNKYYYRFIIGLLFVSAGYIIAIISVLMSSYFQLNAAYKGFDASAKSTLAYKKKFLSTQTNNFKNYLLAAENSSSFDTFLQSDTHYSTPEKEHIKDIMMAISISDSNIMQFRFIADDGMETIRIDRDSIGATPYQIDKKSLQNKADRYYFKETKSLGQDQIWCSNIDLNAEHGKIQKPIVPTIRVAKPYYLDNKFRGILIINFFMENILEEIIETELFYVTVVDKDFHILKTSHPKYLKNKIEWTRYLKSDKKTIYKADTKRDGLLINILFNEQYATLDISDIIRNNEGLKVILEDKAEKLDEYTKDIINYVIIMFVIVFVISFPIVAILSIYPIKLHEELEKSKDALEKELDIIDKFVYMTNTDKDGVITDVSTAFTKLSGYSKEELIGKKHNILKDPSVPKSFFKKMWDTILKGKNWNGEIKNIDKNGKVFVFKSHIAPIFENNEITGFTSIKENITDQKIIEEISIKDELTQCYNRRFFNQTFPKELKRAKRKGDMLCIAMLDIDYFKKYNDTYGHLKGDEVLQKVVKQLSSKLHRASDYLFRFGGEEFMVIFSDIESFEDAEEFSKELVSGVKKLGIEHSGNPNENVVTLSLGLLAITPSCDKSDDEILKDVDNLLYKAKDAGRNRVVSKKC